LPTTQSILIVDCVDETRTVLKMALERKGLEILEAKAPREGLELLRSRNPDLIVLDMELQSSTDGESSDGLARETHARRKPLLMLGSLRAAAISPPPGQIVSKPYHYAPLIRKIEELLGAARQPAVSSPP